MAYVPREDFGLGFMPNAATMRIGGQPGMMARQPYRPQPYVPASLPGVSSADRSQAFFQSLGPLAAGLLAGGAPSTDPGAAQKGLAQGILGMGAVSRDRMRDLQDLNYRKYMMDRQNKADAAAHEERQWKLYQRPMQEAAATAQLGSLQATRAGKEAENAAINTSVSYTHLPSPRD